MSTIDYKKIVLYAALFLVSMMLWQSWQKEQVHKVAQQQSEVTNGRQANGQYIPSVKQELKALTNATKDKGVSHVKAQADAERTAVPLHRLITVKTDVLNVHIDTHGGNIVYSNLPKFAKTLHVKNDPLVLFNNTDERWYQSQVGLTGVNGDKNKTENIIFTSEKTHYQTNGQKELQLVLHGKTSKGVDVKKIYTFHANSYLIGLNYKFNNTTRKPWSGHVYTQLVRKDTKDSKSGMFHISSYSGASVSDPANKLYEKLKFSQMKKTQFHRIIDGGWVAMQQHYFLSAWVPGSPKQRSQFYSYAADDDVYTIGFIGPEIKLAPGAQSNYAAKLYVGPENMKALKQIAPGLDLTIDFGWLWMISKLLFWLLSNIHAFIGNWGWSIVFVTVIIKLVFYKLSATSYRSMAKMRELQPRIEALKERFGDDRQALGKATMELYKTEKVNPLGGCLPMLVQIPFFIGLYWVLIESVELRHAPFMLWIQDLAAPDPFYVLPLLMGVTMFLQQKLSPPPPDPAQAKVMLALPWIFTALFATFPSGLVLYWVVNSGLSLAQQWYVTRQVLTSK